MVFKMAIREYYYKNYMGVFELFLDLGILDFRHSPTGLSWDSRW